ncbi:MAG: DUF4115 domain-containing protein [Streptosporangiaceae bacterium]|nr:DUF4115 domain-containing protein [Streptosporangiaceae bacterium]
MSIGESVSIGETLAEGRRRAGLTITQVSQRTRIRESIIRDIERGDFSACGGDFYARGHIRSIASVVGVDPVPLVREYDAVHGPPGGAISAAEVFEPSTPIRIRERRSFGFGKVMIVVLLAVIGAAAYYLVSHSGRHNPPAAARPPATHVRAKPAASPSPAPSARSAPAKVAVIRLTATQDCWVLLSRANGTQIFTGVVPAGSSKKWTERHAVDLQLGNTPGVEVTVNGKRVSFNTTNPVTLTISPGHKVSVAGQGSGASPAPSPT